MTSIKIDYSDGSSECEAVNDGDSVTIHGGRGPDGQWRNASFDRTYSFSRLPSGPEFDVARVTAISLVSDDPKVN